MQPLEQDWEKRFDERLNNANITGHISGRHLILLGGKKDRKWTGGDYEENEYRFLDEYIKSFLHDSHKRLIEEIRKEIKEYDESFLIQNVNETDPEQIRISLYRRKKIIEDMLDLPSLSIKH